MDERTSSTVQPDKDWASCLPCNSNSTAWLHDSVRFINNFPISLSQKSWCKSLMTSWPSKSTLQRLLDLAGLHYTTSERSGPFWQSMLHNFLSRPWSFLDWTTAMLFWLDFHQTQSNLYKWFRMWRHDWSSTSPKEPMLHLSLSPCTGYQLQLASRFKTLMLAYRTTTGSAPTYFHSLLRIYIPSRSLRSASERRLLVPSQRGSKSLSRTFSFTVPGWWNDLPTPIRTAVSCQSLSNNWKLISFNSTWLHHKKWIKNSLFQNLNLSLSLSLLPLLACTYLNNAWDLVLLALPLSVCLF